MSLLEMDFDEQEVVIRGDNGGVATIELSADEAKELSKFFMEIHDELLKGGKDGEAEESQLSLFSEGSVETNSGDTARGIVNGSNSESDTSNPKDQ